MKRIHICFLQQILLESKVMQVEDHQKEPNIWYTVDAKKVILPSCLNLGHCRLFLFLFLMLSPVSKTNNIESCYLERGLLFLNMFSNHRKPIYNICGTIILFVAPSKQKCYIL